MEHLINKSNHFLHKKTASFKDQLPSCYIEINRQAWNHNIASYKSIVSASVQLGVVLKSNAYGHGFEQMVHLAQNNPSVDWLLVASCKEAVQAIQLGNTKNILVLSILDEYLEQALLHRCSVVVYSEESILRVAHYATLNALKASVHVKIDTGLSRLGISLQHAQSFLQWASSLSGIIIAGIFTHFSDAEQLDHTFLRKQQQDLNALVAYYTCLHKYPIISHSACSAAIGRAPESHGSLIRLGIGAYGLWPSEQTKKHFELLYPSFFLRPVLSYKSTILQIKSIKRGSCIGYDKTFVAQQDMKIATLPIGYYDGLDRQLSNKGWLMINQQKAPIVGRISMNLTTIDVSHIDNVHLDSIVEVVGDHPAISLETHAQNSGRITYDFVTQLGAHIARKYC